MKRILLAPDSFKGTLSASEICQIQREAILARLPDAVVHTLPLSDGGEGLTEALLRISGGRRVTLEVTGPLHTPVTGFYGILPDGSAVIEMAAAAGLPLMGMRRDPLRATTRGVGELIRHAAEHGASRILLGLGGSATNDCGIGMAGALGYRFWDRDGHLVEPLAENLGKIASLTPPEHPLNLEVVAACDVDNPLCGPEGATRVFGPQKGVSPDLFPLLEEGMAHMARLMERSCGTDVGACPGAGAAGGLGAGVLFFLGGRLRSGIDLLLDAVGFDHLLDRTDLVITGEGCMDAQSAHGKVPAGVGRRCKSRQVPCIAVCGSLGPGAEALYGCGISAMFSTLRGFSDPDRVSATCREDLRFLTDSLLRTILALPQSLIP